MNTAYAFRVRIPATTPPAIQLSLHRALERGGATVQEPLESKSLGLDCITFVTIIKDIGEVVGTMNGIMTFYNVFTEWRKKQRDEGQAIQGAFEDRDKPDLDLATATDDEVLQWLLKQ